LLGKKFKIDIDYKFLLNLLVKQKIYKDIIVKKVEKNKITKLNGNYQSKMIEKIKNNFNIYEQQLFLASFYCYLQYDSKNDFILIYTFPILIFLPSTCSKVKNLLSLKTLLILLCNIYIHYKNILFYL
jgi:hypothetical protein